MFKHIRRENAERNDKIKNLENDSATSKISFVVLSETGTIDEVTATEHLNVFSPWVEGQAYAVGNLRTYDGVLYKCMQAHTSQADWTPDKVPSLWKVAGNPADEYPEWSQPYGADDAYQIGDKVTYNGEHWVSTVNSNVWMPSVYGWDKVSS